MVMKRRLCNILMDTEKVCVVRGVGVFVCMLEGPQ